MRYISTMSTLMLAASGHLLMACGLRVSPLSLEGRRQDVRTGSSMRAGFLTAMDGEGMPSDHAKSLTANPFAGAVLYSSPDYAASIAKSIAARPELADKLRKLQGINTALWLDTTARVADLPAYLSSVRAAARQANQPVVATIVVYNLPERDCNANASNGELSIDQDGVNKYHDYIDRIAAVVTAYPDVRLAMIVEPDSLANMATNLGTPKCAKARGAYETGIAYAIRQLARANTALYLDTAHGGWLGWPDNRRKMAEEVKLVLDQAGGVDKIRGFAANVANYSPLEVPPGVYPRWYDSSNPAKDELTFVKLMAEAYASVGINNPAFVIDTSRNGVIDSRGVWGSWCNIAKAGLGERPAISPRPGIDAYLWIKPPGESDGTSNNQAPRFDANCVNGDAMPGAPEAGQWFEEHIVSLVRNANPPL